MSYQKQVDEEVTPHEQQPYHAAPAYGYAAPPQPADPYQQSYQQQGGYVPPQPYQQQGGYQQQPAGYQQPTYQGQPAYHDQSAVYQQPTYQAPTYTTATYQDQSTYQQGYGGQPDYNQPHHVDSPPNDDGKFPEKTQYRDVLFAVLFIAHLIAVLIILAVGSTSKAGDQNQNNVVDSSSSSSSNSANNADSGDFLPWDSIGKALLVCLLGAMAAVGFSVLYLAIIKKYAQSLIKFTLYAGIAWCLILAIIGFATGSVWVGIIFLICAAINALFFYFWRSRIPFATAVLTTVARVLEAYPAPTYYAYGSLVIQCLWVILWVPTMVVIQRYTSTSAAILSVFLIFSFYWVSQVIKNVVHVTASGLVATWYFLSGLGMPRNPTKLAFKRSMTTSFGSICLGSLLVAILKTLRQLVNSRRGGNNWIACIAACILAVLDQLIEYFNMYAFTQVAIYGKTYCQAAKDTWSLCKRRGVDAIVNDNLISGVLIMGALIGGVATAVIGGVIALIAIPDFWIPLAFVCFLVGVSLVMLSMEVVESGVCTIFVCFAMDPAALQRNDPTLYHTFVSTYAGLSV